MVAHRLSCSATRGIFLNQGSVSPALAPDSLPLGLQGRPPPWFNSYKNFDVLPYKFYKSHHREILECQGWKTLIENIT